ncbi:MAG: alpha amylase C-terminal domain-containing protein, partial [Mariprofundaceae bacterium]|nr:alpha amylase C-terminal domain-containing protein [Mariprofundaceae bacterium]
RDKNGGEVYVALNLTPVPRPSYRLGVTQAGFYAELLNTDAAEYAGSNMGNAGGVHSLDVGAMGKPYAIDVILPPLSCVVLQKQ